MNKQCTTLKFVLNQRVLGKLFNNSTSIWPPFDRNLALFAFFFHNKVFTFTTTIVSKKYCASTTVLVMADAVEDDHYSHEVHHGFPAEVPPPPHHRYPVHDRPSRH